MTYSRTEFLLPQTAPGSALKIIAHNFGANPDARSVYIQAGLHADEHPGLLVLQHLLATLKDLDERGVIPGYITVVPFANPIGMAQRLFGPIVGRFDFENGENFNRNFPDLGTVVANHLQGGSNVIASRQEWKRFLPNFCHSVPR